MTAIAAYKGPAQGLGPTLGHWLTCAATLSKYSHVELVMGGICYSSSIRDGGVRQKRINVYSGKWDLFTIEADEDKAKQWFAGHDGQNYDWTGAVGSVLRFIPPKPNHWFCSEAIAASLGMEHPEKITPQALIDAWR